MPFIFYSSGADLFKILLVLILMGSPSLAVTWDEGLAGEIGWGESLTLREYSLKLSDLSLEGSSVPRALLEVYRVKFHIASCVMAEGESSTINNSLRIGVEEIVGARSDDGDPHVRIRIQLPAEPEVALLLVSEKDSYRGGEEVRLSLGVRNTGLVDADDLKVVLDSEPPVFSSSFSRSALGAGAAWDLNESNNLSDHIRINFRAPYFASPTDVKVRARASYKGQGGQALQSFGGAVFWVSGPLKLHKIVEKCEDRERCYLVTDTLENCANRTLVVKLYDEPGPDFTARSQLSRELSLSPGETAISSSLIEPLRPGNFTLPSAEARYDFGGRSYIVLSERPEVEVDGPQVEVRRTASPNRVLKGGVTKVSVELSNKGNRKSMVSLREQAPAGAKLIPPGIDCKFIMPANQSRSLEYSIRCMGPGDITIPENSVIYKDVQGHEYKAEMPALRVQVDVPQEKNMTHQAVEVETKGGAGNSGELDTTYAPLVMILVLAIAIKRYL